MSVLGRRVLIAMIPVNLLMVVWVWIGRIVFGVGGWFILILLMSVVPVVLIALLVTTILAFVTEQRPRALTRAQSIAQIVTWMGMLGFGLFLVDFGDMDESDLSVLTQLLGRNDATLSISWTLTGISLVVTVVTVVAWVVLLVLLVAQRRRPEPAAYGSPG